MRRLQPSVSTLLISVAVLICVLDFFLPITRAVLVAAVPLFAVRLPT
jgi:hypothetical protein